MTLKNSNDGFVIAQKDMEIRGPGDLLGTRQTGEVSYKIADAIRDYPSMEKCTETAKIIFNNYPEQKNKLMERWFPLGENLINL